MKRFALSLFLCLFTFNAFSQEALKSIEEEYFDFLSLQGITERPTLNYRTLSDSEWKFTSEDEDEDEIEHPWKNNNLGTKRTLWSATEQNKNWFTKGLNENLNFKIYGPEWFNSYNTYSPYGQNDGALWQGKGYNTSLTAGARVEAFGFEVTLKPMVCFSENREFDHLPGVYGSEYSYFYSEGGGIDLVQRYGDSSFWTFDWGDTEIRWTWHTFTVGFGTQSPWIGPAFLNPMLGSNNAASYPKFDIGLRKTPVTIPGINWYLGDIEGRIWTGYLSESDYFDNDSGNNHNMLNALSASFSPSFIPGFTVGVNRTFLTRWKKENLKYLFRLFSTNDGNDQGEGEDGKITFTFDWKFEKIGFEAFGEIGKDDYSKFPQNPLHAVIYTVGIKQIIPVHKDSIKGELLFEWNNFEITQDFQTQWQYKGWFSHGRIIQGYTNKGQTLAGGYGTFGNSQYIGFKLYYPKGTSQIFIHRFTPDDNYVSNQAVNKTAAETQDRWHDAWKCYVSVGGSSSYFITDSLAAGLGFTYMKIYNPLYNKADSYQDNFYINCSLKYKF